MAISFAVREPCDELALEELKVGPLFKESAFPDPSVKISVSAIPDKDTFPVFLTVIV